MKNRPNTNLTKSVFYLIARLSGFTEHIPDYLKQFIQITDRPGELYHKFSIADVKEGLCLERTIQNLNGRVDNAKLI